MFGNTERRSAAEVLALVAQATFRDFDDQLRHTYTGCKSRNPKYAVLQTPTGRVSIILDGDCLEVEDLSDDPETDLCGDGDGGIEYQMSGGRKFGKPV